MSQLQDSSDILVVFDGLANPWLKKLTLKMQSGARKEYNHLVILLAGCIYLCYGSCRIIIGPHELLKE